MTGVVFGGQGLASPGEVGTLWGLELSFVEAMDSDGASEAPLLACMWPGITGAGLAWASGWHCASLC